MEGENNIVVVDDTQVDEVGNDSDSLSPAEIEMAKKHSINVHGESKPEVEKKPESVNKAANKDTDNEIPVEDLDSFEKLHDIYEKRPDSFYKLPKNIKQLYHSQKGLYKRMKDEEEKRKKVEDEFGLKKIQDSVARIKLDRIKNRLSNPEGLTVEELQELLDEKREAEAKDDKNKPLTVKDLEDIKAKESQEKEEQTAAERERQANVVRKIKATEEFANENISDLTAGKYNNFDDVVTLAKELVASKPRYGKQIAEAINGDMDEKEIADVILDIARLNPKWGASVQKSDEKVDKIVKNAAKQTTSASLTGGRGSREIHISEDMDPEEAARVWDKIPRDMRHKILRKLPA